MNQTQEDYFLDAILL